MIPKSKKSFWIILAASLAILGCIATLLCVTFWDDWFGEPEESTPPQDLLRDVAIEQIENNLQTVTPSVEPEDVGIATNTTPSDTVMNIALFGLDNYIESVEGGRSDAIIILSIDRVHNKIKFSSIARDVLVNVDGYQKSTDTRDDDWTKIAHAFYYGALSRDEDVTGPSASVKALNENFGLNITKYAYVNFHEFAQIIDLMGGVEVEIEQRELSELNKLIRGLKENNLYAQELTAIGKQNLSGVQALAYARLRKTDSDFVRTGRHREIINSVLVKAKKMSVLDYPDLIRKALSICNTNLTGEEILELAKWLINEEPTKEELFLPNDRCSMYSWDSYQSKNSDAFKAFGLVYIMDLDYASAVLRDFIYETDEVSLLTPRKLTWPELPENLKAALRKETETAAE